MANSANTSAGVGGLDNQLSGSMQQLPSLNNLTVHQLLAASQGNLPTQQMIESPGMLICFYWRPPSLSELTPYKI